MTTWIALVGGIAFVAGLVAAFAGSRTRGRIPGLAAMAAGALVVLTASAPGRTTTWWMAVTGGVTLAGLVWFASALARWTEAAGEPAAALDDEDP